MRMFFEQITSEFTSDNQKLQETLLKERKILIRDLDPNTKPNPKTQNYL